MSERGELVYDVVRLTRPVTLASARVVERSLRPHGLTVGGRAILELLSEGGPATVPDLARALDVSRQAVQRLVNDTVASGHARLSDNPRHRRSQLVGLTERGREVFAEMRREELRQLATLAPECSADALETAHEVLAALARDIRGRAIGEPEAGDEGVER